MKAQHTVEESSSGTPPRLNDRQGQYGEGRGDDKPVADYTVALPQPHRAVAESIDAMVATTLPDLYRVVTWEMADHGVDDGWCFSSGAFVGYLKLMVINGATQLDPGAPVTPTGMSKATRGIEIESVDNLDRARIADARESRSLSIGVRRPRRH